MSRLKEVLQGGIGPLLEAERGLLMAPYTRFEHSVGVQQLIQRLGGSVEEQVAGLLHDVSHTAFSHVVDHVFDCDVVSGESYHELIKESYWKNWGITSILRNHSFDWRVLVREEEYSLLEQPAPLFCADRLDYFFRDGCSYGIITPDDVARIVEKLIVHEGRIVLREEVRGILSCRFHALFSCFLSGCRNRQVPL